MRYRLGVIMDPIDSIIPAKDSTLAMLLEAQARGYELHYMEQNDISIRDGISYGNSRTLTVTDDGQSWFQLGDTNKQALHKLDVILMRKDPPFDMEYVYTTYALELAEQKGCLVINKPQSLRDVNEKLFISWFPQCCAPTLICRDRQQLRDFIDEQKNVVVKPLDGMGGESVFRTAIDDPNKSVIIDTITHNGSRSIMAQRFIAEISAGDKRILMINGEPIAYALARIPAKGESRGNLAAGGICFCPGRPSLRSAIRSGGLGSYKTLCGNWSGCFHCHEYMHYRKRKSGSYTRTGLLSAPHLRCRHAKRTSALASSTGIHRDAGPETSRLMGGFESIRYTCRIVRGC